MHVRKYLIRFHTKNKKEKEQLNEILRNKFIKATTIRNLAIWREDRFRGLRAASAPNPPQISPENPIKLKNKRKRKTKYEYATD